MEVALRRRLDGVAEIAISQHEQTAAVNFVPGTYSFSAEAFRSAVAEADVTVISLEANVCGRVDDRSALRSRTDEDQILVRLRGEALQVGSLICAVGHLDDRGQPYELEVTSSRPLR